METWTMILPEVCTILLDITGRDSVLVFSSGQAENINHKCANNVQISAL